VILGSIQTDSMPRDILKGKLVDPKEVVASRRKSPGPGEYVITSALMVKPKLKPTEIQFDSKTQRFKNSPFDAPSKTTSPDLGPGAYQDHEEIQRLAY